MINNTESIQINLQIRCTVSVLHRDQYDITNKNIAQYSFYIGCMMF